MYHSGKVKRFLKQRIEINGAQLVYLNCQAPRIFHPGTTQNESVHHYVNRTNIGTGKMSLSTAMIRLWTLMLAHNINRIRLIKATKLTLWNNIPHNIKHDFITTIRDVTQGVVMDNHRGWYVIDDNHNTQCIETIVRQRIQECQIRLTETPMWTDKCTVILQKYAKMVKHDIDVSKVQKLFDNQFSTKVIQHHVKQLPHRID